MITPPDDWEPLPGAEGAATAGVWRVRAGGERWIVKRLVRPALDHDQRSFRWWRREVEFARSELPDLLRGVRSPRFRVEEDADGASLWSTEIIGGPIPDPVAARALGTLATVRPADPGWFVVDKLWDRVRLVAQSGGVSLLGDHDRVLDEVWHRREAILDHLDGLPHVLSHGDALPRNLLRHDGDTVTAIDWDQFGYAPIGADLATLGLWVETPVDELLLHYGYGLGPDQRAAAAEGLACTTALVGLSRAIRTVGTDRAGPYRARLDRSVGSMIETLRIVSGTA